MRWGLIGASTIAERHMIGAIRANGGEVAMVASTTEARARDLAGAHGIPGATAWEGVTSLAVAHAVRATVQSCTRQRVDYGKGAGA